MKRLFFSSLLFALLFSACMQDDSDWMNNINNGLPTGDGNGGGGNSGGGTSGGTSYTFSTTSLNGTVGSISDITTFDIALDETALTETETVPSSTEDPNYTDDLFSDGDFTKTVTITYSSTGATYTALDGVSIEQSGAHVIATSTKKVNFILTGSSSDGSFKLYSENKSQITLQNLELTNPAGSALNIQTKKRAFIYCPTGSANTLTDGTTYTTQYSTSTLTDPIHALGEEEDQKGVIFSEGQLIFCGSGSLSLNAKGKNAIASDQYVRFHAGANVYASVSDSGSNGVKCDGLYINGGVINVQNATAAGKGINVEGKAYIYGGRTTLITTGDAVQTTENSVTETTGCAGLKADSLLTIAGGTLLCKSTGSGGKGISTDLDCNVTGGTVYCITTGTTYGSSSSQGGGMGGGGFTRSSTSDTSCKPKAFRVEGNLTISGGTVKVRCCTTTSTGNSGQEGIEAKGTTTISGGNVASFSYDDAVNSAKAFTISGGKVFAYSISNDGLDSNAAMTIKGGWIIAIGTNSPELGIDTVEGTSCSISGGFMMSFSSTGQTQSFSASNGSVGAQSSFSASSGSTIAVTSGSTAMYFVAPRDLSCRFQYYMKGCSSASVSTSGSYSSGSIAPYYNFVATAE